MTRTAFILLSFFMLENGQVVSILAGSCTIFDLVYSVARVILQQAQML